MSSPLKEGIRIVPQISGEMKKKAFAANEKKEKKNAKDAFGKSLKDKMAEFDEPDEFDDMADDKDHNRSLSDRLGFNLKAEEKAKKPQTKRNRRPVEIHGMTDLTLILILVTAISTILIAILAASIRTASHWLWIDPEGNEKRSVTNLERIAILMKVIKMVVKCQNLRMVMLTSTKSRQTVRKRTLRTMVVITHLIV